MGGPGPAEMGRIQIPMSNIWTDDETEELLAAIRQEVATNGPMPERALARMVSNQRRFRERTQAAIYVKIREMNAGGRGWWSHRGVGRQIQI